MLHVITNLNDKKQEISLEDVLLHRLVYAREEGGDESLSDIRDGFDTDSTLYLAYSHKDYGVIGSARVLPKAILSDSMKAFFPANEDVPFVLVDPWFHVPEDSELFDLEDEVATSQFTTLMNGFYAAVTRYLETKAVESKLSAVGFYLDEEEIDLLEQNTEREYAVINTLETPEDEYERYAGILDLSDLTQPHVKAVQEIA